MNSAKLLKTSAVIAMLMAGTAAAQPDREGPPQVGDFPKFATRALAESFQIRPFAWLEASDPPLFDPFNPDGPGQQFAFYDMELSDGSGRLPKGLFATTGPFPLERSNRIYFVSPEGEVEVFREGFAGSNGIVLGGELLELNGGFLVAESVTVLRDIQPHLAAGSATVVIPLAIQVRRVDAMPCWRQRAELSQLFIGSI